MDRVLDGNARPALQEALGPQAMARTLAYLYLGGATLALVSLAAPHGDETNLTAILLLLAVAYAGGAVLFLGARRVPALAIPGALAGGSVLISLAIYFGKTPDSSYSFFYIWGSIQSFYFLSRFQATLQLVWAAVLYAFTLKLVPGGALDEQHWLLVVGTGAVTGMLVSNQRDRIDALVHRLSDAARTDALTGLFNRRGFEEVFALELERARRSGRPLSVAVGDIDDFKLVNDRFGHHTGDEALLAVGKDLEKWKRRTDVAARIGGEEFAVLLPDTDERGAFLVAERLRRATHRSFESRLPLSMSFGIATWPQHGHDSELLLRSADDALFAAKEMGKDRTVLYSSDVASMLARGRGGDGGEMQLATVIALAEALDIRDTGTARHSQEVGRLAELMAEELRLPADRIERVRIAGILHDVGKIGISDRVLTKPGPLSEQEWHEMKTHPQIAARLLSRPEFTDLRSWIVAHHERPDGKGYPEGLSGEEIPLEARILAVADAYEAMTADRVYRPALGVEAARAELTAGAGEQFDADVVQALIRALDRAGDAGLKAVSDAA